MTLHEAIETVLKNNKGAMTASEIAAVINLDSLYKRKDGLPVPSSQIHARVNNYLNIFKKNDGKIELIKKSIFKNLLEAPKSLIKIFDGAYEFTEKLFFGKLDNISNLIQNNSHLDFGVAKLLVVEIYIVLNLYHKNSEKFPDENSIFNFIEKNIKNEHIAENFNLLLAHQEIIKNNKILEYFDNGLINASQGYNKILLKYLDTINFSLKNTKGEFNTPDFLNRLLVSILDPKDNEVVYDPAAGSCNSLIETDNYNSNTRLIGQEINSSLAELGRLKLYLNGSENYSVKSSNSILNPAIEKYVANVIISNPPFGSRLNTPIEIDYNKYSKSSSIEDIFFEMMLSRLNKKNGRMAVILPESFLFNSLNLNLKKHIVDTDALETIISLPIGVLIPYSGVKTSIIVINYDKPKSIKGKTLFINAEDNTEFRYNNRELLFDKTEVNLLIKNIIELYKSPIEAKSTLEHKIILNKAISEQNYDLTARRYTSEITGLIEKIEDKEKLVLLDDIVTKIKPNNIINEEVRLISIKDLSDDMLNFKLNNKDIKFEKINVKNNNVIQESSLLIAKIGKKLKPSYFEYNGEGISTNNNILAFKVDTEKVNVEYLISQLNSEFVLSQIEIVRRGAVIPFLSLKDILQLKIPLPSLSEQYNRLALIKEQRANSFKLTQFINEINLVSTSDEISQEIIRFASKTIKNSGLIIFKKEFEFENFPFSEAEILKTKHIKHSIDKLYWYLLLIDDEKRINGVLIIENENEISFEEYSDINAYANFIISASSKYVQKNTNRVLNDFSHTTKNILKDINKVLNDFLNTKNEIFLNAMNKEYLKDEELMNYLIKTEGRKKDDFLAINRMKDAHEMVNNHLILFKKRHEYYTNSVNSEFEEIKVLDLIEMSNVKRSSVSLTNNTNDTDDVLIIKSAPVALALTDLIDNAVNYSVNEHVNVNFTPKGHYVEIIISNKTEPILSKENYLNLGKYDIKKDNGTYSTGLHNAFEFINENNSISLAPYDHCLHYQKMTRETIQYYLMKEFFY